MATTNRTKDQGQDRTTRQATTQQSTTSGRTGGSSNRQGTERSGFAGQGDRERQIESRRDGGAEADSVRPGMVRQQGNTQFRGSSRDPFTVMQRMAEDMDRLFGQFGLDRSGLGLRPGFGSLLDDDLWSDRGVPALNTVWTPQVETFRRGNNLVIRADIPGVDKDDVHVEIEHDVLTISGERREEHEENRDGYYRSECRYGQFYRAIQLPEGTNADHCEASFKDGVLELTLPAPRQEERRPKRIQIK